MKEIWERNKMGKPPPPSLIKESIEKSISHILYSKLHILKCAAIPLLPSSPHKAQRNHIPNIRTMLRQPIPPAKQEIHHRSRHNPMDPKEVKDLNP
jgi:hypothetical protein